MNITATLDLKPTAFDQAVLVHRGLLLRAATSMVGTEGDAEDLVQETLLKALRAFDRLKPGSKTRPWLLRILRNTFISGWRRRKTEREVLRRGVEEVRATWLHPDSRWSDPLGKLPPTQHLDDEVFKAIAEVPNPYRDTVILIDVHQRSYQEAATLTDQPLGTVQSRLFRGRRILKELLGDYARSEGYLQKAA